MTNITMRQKNAVVRNYIVLLAAKLKKSKINLEAGKILELNAKYLDSDKDILEIKQELDELVNSILKSIAKIEKDANLKRLPHKEINQAFNYHTHTYRCGHAEYTQDKEYIENAIMTGISRFGFSEHSPTSELENVEPNIRMPYNDVDDYIKSILNLKDKYKEKIEIMCGFEAEYDDGKEGFLRDLRKRVDYLILGQHFVKNIPQENNPKYPIEYAKTVEKAIESGLFDIVAHPDIFMMHRSTIPKSKKSEFVKNVKDAAIIICLKAKEYDIPIEINLGKVEIGTIEDNEYLYPYSVFWQIAEMTGVKVLYAIDAHSPKQILTDKKNKKLVESKINIENLNFVGEDYDPKIARLNNTKLQMSYEKSKKKDIPFEEYYINRSLESLMNTIKDKDFDPATLVGSLRTKIEKNQKAVNNEIKEYITLEEEKIKKCRNIDEKNAHLDHLGKIKAQHDKTLKKRTELVNKIYSAITEAIYKGARTKDEIMLKTKKILDKKNKKEMKEQEEVIFTKVEHIDSINENKSQNDATLSSTTGSTTILQISIIALITCSTIGIISYLFNYLK